MKAYRESGGKRLSILNFDPGWSLVVNIMLWPLYPSKKTRCPLNRKLGGPYNLSGGFEERKNL